MLLHWEVPLQQILNTDYLHQFYLTIQQQANKIMEKYGGNMVDNYKHFGVEIGLQMDQKTLQEDVLWLGRFQIQKNYLLVLHHKL